MQHNGLWTRSLTQRLSRRRAIATTGSAALGAAFLAACGGGSSSSSSGGGKDDKNVSGLVTPQKDTTKEAKKGGTLKFSLPADIQAEVTKVQGEIAAGTLTPPADIPA